MKKIININFHSRVIPIEESAYEILQQYIDSLRRHFAHEEGKDEIISDIENRFAELFSETLKKGAACITDADVNTIIASMGRPEDFEEEETPGAATASSAGGGQSGPNQPNWQYASGEPRRLYRSENDKILGGVCGGLANYLRVDPAVVRIIFALTSFGWGAGFLVYIVLWIVLPTRSLPTNFRKRLYRNPDNKVIAGVASGLAAYFHIDVWIPRLIFSLPLIVSIIISIFHNIWWGWDDDSAFFTGGFGGTLFIAYIVLWIVLPEAVTASEKLEMRGEKVDLESIKNTIKSDLEGFKGRWKDVSGEMQEKVQRFAREAGPALQKTGTGFGHAVGVLFKVFFLFIAGTIAFALIMALAGLAFRGGGLLHLKGFILEGFWQNFLAWGAFFLFLVIPVIALLTWLIRRITGVRSRSHYLGYTFATLWVIGLFATIVLAGMIMNNFRSRQHVEESVSIVQPSHGKMVVRTVRPINRYDDTDWWFDVDWGRNNFFYTLSEDSILIRTVQVRLLKSEDSNYHVRLIKLSRGSSAPLAKQYADEIVFPVSQSDSILDLAQGFTLTRGQKFRNQQVRVEVSVPVGRRILVSSTVEDYNWININPRHRHINWGDDDDWGNGWEEDINDENTYPWVGNVEYMMTANGLVRTDHKTYSEEERRGRNSEERRSENNDDDQPEYKSKDDSKKNNGGYRYKGPDTPTDKKKTVMTTRPEDRVFCLLSDLNYV
jgi:phage shock protein PspC (stress-responsive transcriptional regulator)